MIDADLRHDAERRSSSATGLSGEHVVKAEHRALRATPVRRAPYSPRGICCRAVTASRPKVNNNSLAQFRNGKMFWTLHRLTGDHFATPPAASIFWCAVPLNLCARTVSFWSRRRDRAP